MDSDLFFSESRWKILEILAVNSSSPLEISRKINTSVAYVSQQLKLLEAAKLIVKEKTGLVEKGKPRSLYDISKELLHLTALIKGGSMKKLIYLSDYHKIILKIWLLENSESHYYIEKLYWRIEEDLKDIKSILINNSKQIPAILIVTDSKTLKLKINSFLKEINNWLECYIISEQELKKVSHENLFSIYDSNFLVLEKEVKGGIK